ncbi:hypothetical protein [Hymenobacter perfusus]|uniref:Uncharacterized protein n=1 Tax=Hymenobacter perfusus TaxID=1236770 RepID=A0A3R9NG48_9BACT|nr:hypothetical protein [Hymenobacter perfusus]RSK46341.1 hypothetical protein EI293_04005 [Hymenobacter perfusus]
MQKDTIEVESNHFTAKAACYAVIAVSCIICLAIIMDANRQHVYDSLGGRLLLVVFIGVLLPWYHQSTVKRSTLTISQQVFHMEQEPDKVLYHLSMKTLVGWWIGEDPRRKSAGRGLHFDCKDSGHICLLSYEYSQFAAVERYLEVHFAHKKRHDFS